MVMQDKILFAAGLVALFIGLFIGVRTDNASKKMENELNDAKRLVVSLEQQVGTERTKSSSLDQQLQTAARQLTATENKLTASASWYDKLQDANSSLAKDIYHIRLSLEDVSADLQDGRQSEALDKTQELMKLLDERHAVTKEEPAEQEKKETAGSGEKTASTAGNEAAEESPTPQKEEGAVMNKQMETSVPAEQGQDESRAAAEAPKQPEDAHSGGQEATPQGDDAKKEIPSEKVQL